MTTADTQTRQHPRGDYLMRVGSCPTCGPHEVVFGPPDSRITHSTAPDTEGRYTVQAHADWCPVWTGETLEGSQP